MTALSVALSEIAVDVVAKVISCVRRDPKANSAYNILPWAAHTKLWDATPPHAVQDKKLGGSDSELEGCHV
jgi:hypothetical protein